MQHCAKSDAQVGMDKPSAPMTLGKEVQYCVQGSMMIDARNYWMVIIKIIMERGFSNITISELASELHCSASSLYKIASNKDGLVVLAIARWGELALEDFEAQALHGATSIEKARLYWHAAVDAIRLLSHEFRSDVDHFESARLAYANVSNRFIQRFVELLDNAVESGEIEPINTCFVVHVFRNIAFVVRDEGILNKCGSDCLTIIAGDRPHHLERIKKWKGGKTIWENK